MREAEVRKEIVLYGLTWEDFQAFIFGKRVEVDGMGKYYFTSEVSDFINANKPKEMKQLINQYDTKSDANLAIQRDVYLFIQRNYTVLFGSTFFDTISSKHTSIIFYYE